MSLAISADGMHYVVGLIDGSLVIKSKQLEEHKEEVTDEMKFIMDAFNPKFVSKSKNYKYFNRGQYNVMPDPDDIIQSMQTKRNKL